MALIRQLTEDGIIQGIRVSGEERRYNEEELALLRRARRLQDDLGINLPGVEAILRLSAYIEALQQELAHFRKHASPPHEQ